uniref:RdRp catalytic domain-containing protein n=1 Tax=Pararge aegeria TaxID=116150 RepID=S4PIU9_9NEOP
MFKKQQHGGLREIYVLDEVTRVLQLFIETCARTICREFEEESLTNPRRKLPIINNHYNKTRKYARATNRYCINSNSSMDKTKWNQGFMIRAIAAPLFRLLPQKFHGSLQTIMNMWIGKDIKIPPEVIDLLLKDIRLSSEAYERLRKEFYGVMEHDDSTRPITRSKFNSYVTIQSGFMQGILHYTSSLLHLSFLSLTKSLLYKIIHRTFDGASALISFACSSDDSAIMVSLFFKKDSKFFSLELINQSDQLEKLLHTIENFSKFFCMRPSVKSTVGMLDSVEFNSEFIFNNTLAVPVLKFVIAANNCLPYESLLDKLNGSYNLISALYSSGFPSFNTHLCQISQLMLHYKSLGLGLSPLDNMVCSKLLRLRDPNYGFFPLDSHLCPGVMGLPYSLYKVYKTTGVLPISPKALKKESIISLESGVPSETLQISHGDRRKQKKLILGLHQVTEGGTMKIIPPSSSEKFAQQLDNCMRIVREEVNANYELFYRAAETDEELILKIKLKALMPGVAKSLNSGNVHIQNTSASLYSSHTACMSLNAERFVAGELSRDNPNKVVLKKTSVKVSLLKAIVKREQELDSTDLSYDQTRTLEQSCFPLLKRYEEFERILESFKDAVEQKVPRFRSQKNKIEVLPHKSKLPLSLLDTVKIVWFGHKNPTSKTVLDRCFAIYQGLFEWLSENHDRTLELSPFSTPTEMFSFLNSINDGGRSMLLTCPSIPYSGFRGQISHLIKKNYKQCIVLRRPLENHSKTESNKHMKDKLSLSLFITDPELLQKTVESILSSEDWEDHPYSNVMELTKQEQILHFLKLHYKVSPEEFREHLSDYMYNCNAVYLLMYTQEQRKIVGKDGRTSWIGPGEVVMKVGRDILIYRLIDDEVVEIRSPSLIAVTRNLKTIKDSMTELRVRPIMSRFSGFQVAGKYNGDRVVSNSSIGSPIKIDPSIENRYLQIKDHKIIIDNGKISLLYKAAQNRWVRLMNYYPAKEGIDVSVTRPPIDDCWEAWLNVSPWKGESALITVDQLKTTLEKMPETRENWRDKRSEREKQEVEKFRLVLSNYKTFLSTTLKTRIVNLKSQRLYIDECLSTIGEFIEEEDDSDLGDDFFNDLIMTGLDDEEKVYNDLIGAIKATNDTSQANMSLESDIADDVDDLLLTMSEVADPGLKALAQILTPAVEDNPLSSVLYRRITTEYTKLAEGLIAGPKQLFATHPLWDDLITTLDRLDSRLISNMMDGIVSAYDSSNTKLLMWLLEIKERNVAIRGVDLSRGIRDERLSRIQKFLDSIGSEDSDSE